VIAAVIPCYNEEKEIDSVVRGARRWVDTVIVVDNLSTDETVNRALLAGATGGSCPTRGAGAATKTGLVWALNFGAEIIVTLDGDGQHDPEEIPQLLDPVRHGYADVAIGSRFLEQKMARLANHADLNPAPAYRRFGIGVITTLYNWPHDPVSDGQSCFRSFSRLAVEVCLPRETGFGFSTEMLVRARKAGLRLVEVPVSCIYHREQSLNSSMNPMRHGCEVAAKTLRWRLWEYTGV